MVFQVVFNLRCQTFQVGQYRLKLGRDEIEKLLEGADEEKKADDHEDRAGGGAVKVNFLDGRLVCEVRYLHG